MIIQKIIENNQLVQGNSIFNINTIIKIEKQQFSVDYTVFFSNEGTIYLFYNNSTLPNFYEIFSKSNTLSLQLFDKIGVKTQSVKKIKEHTRNIPYYYLLNNILKFVSNKSYSSSSWELILPSGFLCVTNKHNKLPYMSFTGKLKPITLANTESKNKHNISQKISTTYMSLEAKSKLNIFFYTMFKKLNFSLNYDKAYLLSKSDLLLIKAKCNKSLVNNNEKINEIKPCSNCDDKNKIKTSVKSKKYVVNVVAEFKDKSKNSFSFSFNYDASNKSSLRVVFEKYYSEAFKEFHKNANNKEVISLTPTITH
jgi:hypothetical protein